MPAFVGAVKLNSIGTAGVFHIGDVFIIAPVSTAKTFAGAGSFNTGDGAYVNNRSSTTNTYDRDIVDQSIVANA
jgi:spore germination protein PA